MKVALHNISLLKYHWRHRWASFLTSSVMVTSCQRWALQKEFWYYDSYQTKKNYRNKRTTHTCSYRMSTIELATLDFRLPDSYWTDWKLSNKKGIFIFLSFLKNFLRFWWLVWEFPGTLSRCWRPCSSWNLCPSFWRPCRCQYCLCLSVPSFDGIPDFVGLSSAV